MAASWGINHTLEAQEIDYSQPFVSDREDDSSIGRVMFMGDSITHGIYDMTHRWQLHKILVDNGIENEVVGPLNGYTAQYSPPNTSDYQGEATSYGGSAFANVHLAQASGRTHNLISGSKTATVDGKTYTSGVNYGGYSTSSAGTSYDCNTWICMMGTNDLLSDTHKEAATTDEYCKQMQKMIGGTVSYDTTSGYTWSAQDSQWGTMGTIVNDVCKDGDTFYMLSVTPWGDHSNHNRDEDHYAGAEFNKNLEAWTKAYSEHSGHKIVYVDVTRGMVDVTSSKRFMGYNNFYNSASDRLHPNEQGSLLMAGNLAQGMGIGGRTAGLVRASSETEGTQWTIATESNISLSAGDSKSITSDSFDITNGYTIDFMATFGDGAANNWLDTSNKLDITIGDGINTGTLSLTEGYIMWGEQVLFCQDNSLAENDDNLRIAWHNGNAADNVGEGYYVWLGDMLIGQALDGSEGTMNGITLSTTGSSATIKNLIYSNTAYAPTTEFIYSEEHAYITTQDVVIAPMPSHTNTATNSNLDFTGASSTSVAGNSIYTKDTVQTATANITITACTSWVGITNTTLTETRSVQVTGEVTHTVFGTMKDGNAAELNLQVEEGASINGGQYTDTNNVMHTAAIAGSYDGGYAEAFNVYINGGSIGGDIVGGAVHSSGSIDTVKIVVNDGTLAAIYGGSKTAGTVGSAEILVNGGNINGGIVAGGSAGTIGNTTVTLMGGVINGNITKGAATRSENATSQVVIGSNKAWVSGNIEADTVSVKNVEHSGYGDGFDVYSGTITATTIELENTELTEAHIAGVSSISATEGTNAELNAGAELSLKEVTLGGQSTLGLFIDEEDHSVSTETETTLTVTGSFTIQGEGNVLNANLVIGAGSELNLGGNSLQLGSSLTLNGTTLDDATMSAISALGNGESLTLFTEVDQLIVGDTDTQTAWIGLASAAFANEGLENYNIIYSGADNGGTVSIMSIPEPTTATLSLLALAALAARRRHR